MQHSLVEQLLTDNKWVSSAEEKKPFSDTDDSVIYINISPDGHELICNHGMREFELRMLDVLPDHVRQKARWQIGPVQNGYFENNDFIRQFDIPPVLSWVNESPQHKLLLAVSPEMECFKGHYPDNPILPGIVQVHWAIGVSMELFGLSESPNEIKRLKFKNVVQPPHVIELDLRKSVTNTINFQFNSVGQVHSMGCLVFREDKSCGSV